MMNACEMSTGRIIANAIIAVAQLWIRVLQRGI